MKECRFRFARTMTVVVAAIVLAPQLGIAATEVNTCGQVVAGSAYLAADLDCTGFGGDAVTIDGGALDLSGFTLTGGAGNGVTCMRGCKVTSDPANGTITGASAWGVYGDFAGGDVAHVRVSNVRVEFNGDGIDASSGNATLIDSVVSNNVSAIGGGVSSFRTSKLVRTTVSGHPYAGVTASKKIVVVDSDVSANPGLGLWGAPRIIVRRSTVTLNGQDGIHGGTIKVVDSAVGSNGGPGVYGTSDQIVILGSTVSNNGGDGIFHEGGLKPVTVKESTISGNALSGIRDEGAENLRVLQNSVITGNGLHGIYATNTDATPDNCAQTIRDSVVTGNGTDPNCGVTETCADLAACDVPNILNVTCDISYDTLSGFPGTSWSVCSLD